MARLSVPARIYVWCIIVAGSAMLVVVSRSWSPTIPEPAEAAAGALKVAAFLGILVYAGLHPVQLGPSEKMNVGTTLTFGALLVLPPFPATLLSVIGAGTHNALLRRRWDNVLLNMGQQSLTVGSAALVFRAFDPASDSHFLDSADLAAAGAAAGVYFAVATTVLGVMLAFAQKKSPRITLTGVWRQTWVQYSTLMALSIVLAALYQVQPTALLLAIPPMIMVHRDNEQLALIKQTNQKLEETLQAQRRFVSDASHELRSPLTAIQGNVQLLLSNVERAESVRDALTDIAQEANRLTRLVADLLVLAQADEGQTLSLEPMDLEALSYEVYRQMRPLAGQVAVRFELDENREEGVIAWLDSDRFRQLLGNLLDNAIKYTPAGGEVRVRLRTERDWAQVEVSDTGIGIPREHQERIFERFYRIDKARARTSGGAGLGLAIARWIATAHGGRLTVNSDPDRGGSTFTIWLPLRAA